MSEPALPPEIEELLTHQGWVRRLCRHLAADEVEADEIEQETWRRAMESPPRHRKNLKAWLSAVARSAFVHRTREERGSQARPRRIVSMDAEANSVPLDSGERPDSRAERRETFEVLQRLVAELEDPYGEMIFLRYIEGHAPRRIAKKLGVPLRTVQSRLYRGLQILRRRVHAQYGSDWRARCLVFVPSLPSVAASTLTTTIAMSKPIKLTLAAAAVLLAVPVYSVLTEADGEELEPAQELEAVNPDLGTGDAQDALAGGNVDSNAGRVETAPESDGSIWIQVLDEAGAEVLDFSASVYRDGKHYSRKPKQGARFTWPIEADSGGLVFVYASGRVPFWTWLDPSISQEIVLPTGKELLLRNIANDDPTAFVNWISLDFSSLMPTVKSDLYRYREHLSLQNDPLRRNQNTVQAQLREGNVRFWGLPSEFAGELQLAIKLARWEDAEHDGRNWQVQVTSAAESLDVKLYAWPSWTLQVQYPQNHRDPERRGGAMLRLDQAQRYSTPLGSREVDPQDPLLESITIPKTHFFPPPDRADGWAANLEVAWNETRHRFSMVLPLVPGDLGRFVVPEPEAFEVQALDPLGNPIPEAAIYATDDQFLGGLTDENGILVFDSLAGPEIRQAPPTLDLYPKVEGYMPNVQSVQLLDGEPAKMVLEAARGLSIKFQIFEGESTQPIDSYAIVLIRCVGDDQKRPGGLFGREITDLERGRLVPDMGGGAFGREGDYWGLEIEEPELDRKSGKWGTQIFDLNPTHPVLIQVVSEGAELYREEISVWPTGQFVERDLKLRLPEAIQVRGIVVDQDGERVGEASVNLKLPNGQYLDRRSDAFGRFDFGEVYANYVQVSASTTYGTHLELVPFEALPNEDGVVELRLEMQRTQPMQVQVLHADGSPFEGTEINARLVDGGQRLSRGKSQLSPGVFEVQAPPSGAVRAWVYYENWTYAETFEVGQGPFVIQLAEHVGIEVQLPDGIAPGGRRTWLRFKERAEGGSSAGFFLYGSQRHPPSEDGTFQERPTLPPGEYQAYLQQSADGWVTISDFIEFDILPATPVTLDFRSAKPIPKEG
jgi:RNA polymerase sigma-70 factor, ECF subfamily